MNKDKLVVTTKEELEKLRQANIAAQNSIDFEKTGFTFYEDCMNVFCRINFAFHNGKDMVEAAKETRQKYPIYTEMVESYL